MASVCGGCLALMDAGVPIREPVAGIAMGLVLDPSGKFVVLSDILGSEDALGDMDFKVAGGMVGVTAFQMDIKVEGITLEIMRVALERARVGRKHILGEMLKSKRGPRGALSPFAPRMARLVIPKEKIGALIGPQGKVVRAIQAAMGATVTVDSDSGSVDILTPNEGSLARTREVIQAIVAEPEKGKLYRGCVVTGLAAFGAFVEILPGKTGLVHISELDVNGVKEVSDAVKVGTRAGMRRGSCCEPSRTRAPWPRPAGGRRRRRDAPGHDGQRQDEAEQARGADIPKGFARGQVA